MFNVGFYDGSAPINVNLTLMFILSSFWIICFIRYILILVHFNKVYKYGIKRRLKNFLSFITSNYIVIKVEVHKNYKTYNSSEVDKSEAIDAVWEPLD